MTKESQDKKEQRAREGAKAMADYTAASHAVREKTARLKALRLAKEATETISDKASAIASEKASPKASAKASAKATEKVSAKASTAKSKKKA
jgi:hypothetical protein